MLVVCILASALGALIMCLLVMRAGFSPTGANPEREARDILIARFGHAAAGVCFATTVILATVMIARPAARPPVTPDPKVTERLATLDRERETLGSQLAGLQASVQSLREGLGSDVQTLRTRLDSTDGRVAKTEDEVAKTHAGVTKTESELAKTEAGLARAESALKRLTDDLAQANVRARQVERASAARPAAAPARETVIPAPVRTPARRSSSEAERVERGDRTDRAQESASPAAPEIVVPATPSPHVDTPVSHPAAAATPAPKPASAAASARKSATPPPQGSATSGDNLPETSIGNKMRKDWDTIRRGFETAGDELASAVKSFGRRVTGRD